MFGISTAFLILSMLAMTTQAIFRDDLNGEGCQTRGMPCVLNSDCCWGLCEEGTCRPCSEIRGKVCSTKEDCCGLQVCSASGICVKRTTAAAGGTPQQGETMTSPPLIEDPAAAMTSWPNVMGMAGEEAKAVILTSNPKLHVEILLEGTPVTLDWRDDRVRIVVDETGIVVQVPTIG